MIIRFLGTHNAESKNTRLVSFLIDDILAVEAGSLVSELTFVEQSKIKAILLSHGHYDHIRAVPAFAFNNPDRTTKIQITAPTNNSPTAPTPAPICANLSRADRSRWPGLQARWTVADRNPQMSFRTATSP